MIHIEGRRAAPDDANTTTSAHAHKQARTHFEAQAGGSSVGWESAEVMEEGQRSAALRGAGGAGQQTAQDLLQASAPLAAPPPSASGGGSTHSPPS